MTSLLTLPYDERIASRKELGGQILAVLKLFKFQEMDVPNNRAFRRSRNLEAPGRCFVLPRSSGYCHIVYSNLANSDIALRRKGNGLNKLESKLEISFGTETSPSMTRSGPVILPGWLTQDGKLKEVGTKKNDRYVRMLSVDLLPVSEQVKKFVENLEGHDWQLRNGFTHVQACKNCGSPMFVAKSSGRMTCSDICWEFPKRNGLGGPPGPNLYMKGLTDQIEYDHEGRVVYNDHEAIKQQKMMYLAIRTESNIHLGETTQDFQTRALGLYVVEHSKTPLTPGDWLEAARLARSHVAPITTTDVENLLSDILFD